MSEEPQAYVVVHGHFYQPPRENPWTGEVERQKEAAPYHDWNELITYQCYLPNGCARVVDEKGRIVDIVNNYSYISFNFGPTLFSWMEKKFPQVVDLIIQADKESASRNNGQGNAIAQVYNHMIMPLASERDKYTQLKWGIRYFEKKFGRYPQAIWLPETAINYPTVKVLIDVGMKFIILSPYQAEKIKPLNGGEDSWQDVSNGSIDTTRVYRLFLKDEKGAKIQDKFIEVFFYHGELSRAIAFEKILKSSASCADRIEKTFKEKKEFPSLISIATDGETYGHYEPFSDMCLAHLMKYELPKRGIKVINYPFYLKSHSSSYEVKIKEGKNGEGTSWSCAHGVGRWKEDCGCNTGAHPEWNQKWRAPLRQSLDWLRDRLVEIFEREGGQVFKEAWLTRDDYIEVIMERSPDNVDRFLQNHLKIEPTYENKVKALKLLEMQRFAMLMYTSCGWFFDELSGVETVQNLKYAARSIQLAKQITGEDLEEEFLNRLSQARSNLKALEDGRGVYRKLVKPSVVDWQNIFAYFLISEQLIEDKDSIPTYQYKFETLKVREKESSGVFLRVGKGKLTSSLTFEVWEGIFFVAYFGGHKIYCFVNESVSDEDYFKIHEKLFSDDIDLNLEGVRNVASPFFGKPYTLKDIFPENKEKILSYTMKDRIKEIREINETLFEKNIDLLREFTRMGWQIAPEFIFSTGNVLNYRIMEYISKFEQDEDFSHLEKVKNIIQIANELGLKPDTSFVAKVVEKIVLKKMKTLNQHFDLDTVKILLDLNKHISSLNIHYRRYETQNELWKIIGEKIVPQIDKILETKEGVNFLHYFFLLAEDFNFNVDSLREKSGIQGNADKD